MDNEHGLTRLELATFVRQLLADFQAAPESWENQTLPDFLEAMAAWIDDMDGWYKNRSEEVPAPPSWATFAQILGGATVYE